MTETAAEAWARCRGFVEAALAHANGGHTIGDVQAGIESGLFHFWPGERCAVVTEFWTHPRTKTLNFWLLGGDLRELLKLRPHIEAWAVQQGCSRALGGGVRPGWGRALAAFGYRPGWTIYVKELGA